MAFKFNAITGKLDYYEASSGGSGHIIQEEGASLTARTKLNFVGANVTATDDAGNDATIVTITAGSSLPVVDTTAIVKGSVDDTKLVKIEADGLTTGTTRTLSVQDADGTIALTANKLSAFAATTSAELAGVISDETGTGALVFANTPTLVTPVLGAATGTSVDLSNAGVAGRFVNTSDSTPVQVVKFEGDRATMADGDEAYASLILSNDAGTQTEFGRIRWTAVDVNAGTNVDGSIKLSTVVAGTMTGIAQFTGGLISPTVNDSVALGNGSLMWSDLFLASGGVINFNNGNATITHSAGLLTSNVDVAVPDEAYGAGWNGSLEVPTKNAVYDKVETLSAGGGASLGLITAINLGFGGTFFQ